MIEDNIFCPHCGMGFTLRSDYIEHIRCYVPNQHIKAVPVGTGVEPLDVGGAIQDDPTVCSICRQPIINGHWHEHASE